MKSKILGLACFASLAALGSAQALETELQVGLMGSANQIAAVAAAMSGEPGVFTDAS